MSVSERTPGWLKELLADSQVTDIGISAQRIGCDRGQGMRLLELRWDENELKSWLLHQLSRAGKSWDARHPFVDATFSADDEIALPHRAHALFPPVSPGIELTLRKLPRPSPSQRVWATSPYYPFLRELVRRGETLLISGSTGSGKTTLASELLSEVSPDERIVALEDTRELAPFHPQFIPLLSRPPNADGFGEVSLRTLLKQTLRMRPDRIVLGECRGAEVLDLLQALNTGHRGTIATLHANSPREALRRIELLGLLAAGDAIPLTALRELLALGVQWIVQVERTPEGRKVRELVQVAGREGDAILLRPKVLAPLEPLQLLG